MGRDIDKNISKNLRVVDTANNLLYMLNNTLQMHLKLPEKEQFKKQQRQRANKITDKITKISKTSQQNNLVIVTNEDDKELLKKICMCVLESQKIVDYLRLI